MIPESTILKEKWNIQGLETYLDNIPMTKEQRDVIQSYLLDLESIFLSAVREIKKYENK